MPHLLLLGAGFSRNWGGWVASEAFEYLLGCPEIIRNQRLRDLLWKHQLAGGFEDALAELQGPSGYAQPQWEASHLIALQGAVGRMFDDMNRSFLELTDWEFQSTNISRMVRTFLARFDAIFTLNQDLLLEHFYCTHNVVQRTAKPHIPGMSWKPSQDPMHGNSWSRAEWSPRSEGFAVQRDSQPLFKLHGSSNWYSADGSRVLIIGGEKLREIGRYPVLDWYAREFERYLMQPNARLMVMGYGFRDPHVSDVIGRAVERGLKLFVIDPAGAEIAFKLNKTRQSGQITGPDKLEDMLKASLIGGSRRPLSEIFGTEGAEFNKVMKFFQ